MTERASLRLWSVSGLAGLLLAASLAAWPAPETGDATICLFRRVTGISCPGCGLTRACAKLAKGDVAGSVHLHPLGGVIAAQVALAWAFWGWRLWRRRPPLTPNAVSRLAIGNLVALLAVWIVRLASGTLPP